MAKVRPIIGEMSGSIAGVTYSRNKGGLYAKRRANPTNPSSTKQMTIRTALGTASVRWSATLTAAQRNDWNAWASVNPVTDVFGDPITLTGQQCYIKFASRLLYNALTAPANAPVVPAPAGLLTFTASCAPTDSTVSIAFTPTPTPANTRLVVWWTQWRLIGATPNQRQVSQIDLSAAAQASPFVCDIPVPAPAGKTTVLFCTTMFQDGQISAPLQFVLLPA